VSLGEITKQLAKEALGAQVDELLDPQKRPEAAASPAPESLAHAIIAQVQAMQNALKDDQELLVSYAAGKDTVRVFELFAPSPRLLVLTGADQERALTRIVVAADVAQLICKPMSVAGGAKPVRLRFILPKAKGA
jgi:hypothetical protein